MIAAQIDGTGIVVQVIEAPSLAWCSNTIGGTWVETWIDGGTRKNYAGIGYRYDAQLDAYIPPRPYPSWILESVTCQWNPPKPYPANGKWIWDEDLEDWVAA